jgi:hypothetical protein
MIAAYTSLFVALFIKASAMFRVTAFGRKKFISGESPNTYHRRVKGGEESEDVERIVSALDAACSCITTQVMIMQCTYSTSSYAMLSNTFQAYCSGGTATSYLRLY